MYEKTFHPHTNQGAGTEKQGDTLAGNGNKICRKKQAM